MIKVKVNNNVVVKIYQSTSMGLEFLALSSPH